MKRCFLFAILLLALILGGGRVYAQSNLSQIKNELQVGNVINLARSFASEIDLTLPSGSDTYGKAAAAQQLLNFFQSNTPQSFTIKHNGTAPDGSTFMVGTMATSGGNYRTYLVFRQNAIQELSFEKQ